MSEWNIVRFEEISDFKYGKMPKKEKLNKGKYPVFTGYRIAGYYPEFMYEEPQLVVIARGVGGTGNVVISPSYSYVTNLSIVALLDKSKCDLEYLYYYFQNNSLRYLDSGSVQSQITIQNLKNLELPLPEFPIQKKIAYLLKSFDNKIENNRKINETLEAMAQAVFKSWFVDFEPTRAKIAALEAGGSEDDATLAAMTAISGKDKAALELMRTSSPDTYEELKSTANLFPSSFQESELGQIPEGWEVKTVGNAVDTISETYPLKTVSDVIFLNTGDILNGRFLHSNKSDASNLPGQAKKSIREGDILYSEIRPQNKRFAFVCFDGSEHVVSTKLMVLRSTTDISSLFIYFVLTQQSVIDYLQMMAESRSGTFPQITFDVLSKVNYVGPADNQLIYIFTKNIVEPFYRNFISQDKEI